jgi:hypothetical protein
VNVLFCIFLQVPAKCISNLNIIALNVTFRMESVYFALLLSFISHVNVVLLV